MMRVSNIVIRADASSQVGIGHIMRCLTIAEALKLQANGDFNVLFVCNYDLPKSVYENIINFGFKVQTLPIPQKEHFDFHRDVELFKSMVRGIEIDWIMIDHYGIDYRWEQEVRSVTRNIAVIDDLANRRHDCDIIVDQNYYPNYLNRYDRLVPSSCIKLLGPANLILRREFREKLDKVVPRTRLERVLVSFGGSDPTDETSKVLDMLELGYFPHLQFDIVLGQGHLNRESILQRSTALSNVNCVVSTNHISDLILKADLAIGAGGISLWERCILGLPSIVIEVADNQHELIHTFEQENLIWALGRNHEVTSELIKGMLMNLNQVDVEEASLRVIHFMNSIELKQLPVVNIVSKTI